MITNISKSLRKWVGKSLRHRFIDNPLATYYVRYIDLLWSEAEFYWDRKIRNLGQTSEYLRCIKLEDKRAEFESDYSQTNLEGKLAELERKREKYYTVMEEPDKGIPLLLELLGEYYKLRMKYKNNPFVRQGVNTEFIDIVEKDLSALVQNMKPQYAQNPGIQEQVEQIRAG
jgi:hypothetical protein